MRTKMVPIKSDAKPGRPKSALVALRKRFLAFRKAKGVK